MRLRNILLGFLIMGQNLSEAEAHDKKIVIGFSQIGAESAWRIANTRSIEVAASASGIELLIADAQQQRENQIKAIKRFILQKVDLIVLSPVVSNGWRDVLLRARKAKIPVIILDREIIPEDRQLVVTTIGSDFREEGRRAARCLLKSWGDRQKPMRVLEIRGTSGSAPATERGIGFREVLDSTIVDSGDADFRESLAREWTAKTLIEQKKKGLVVDAIFAHNDNMALGAMAAAESLGMRPGKDILIVSIDAIRDALEAIRAGKIACSVECSPLLGPALMQAVRDILEGRHVSPRVVTQEAVFDKHNVEAALKNRAY